jgi:hypothetical protein
VFFGWIIVCLIYPRPVSIRCYRVRVLDPGLFCNLLDRLEAVFFELQKAESVDF